MPNVVIGPGSMLALWVGFVALFYGSAIWVLVDAAKRPEWQFAATGKSRTLWIMLPVISMACCGIVGVVAFIVYFASVRPQLERAQQPWPSSWPGSWPGMPGPPDQPAPRWEVGGGVGDDSPPPPPPPPPRSPGLPPPPPPPLG